MKLSEVLVRPVITEKVNLQMERSGRYTFVVGKQANKLEIKKAVEEFYGVKVADVNTVVVPANQTLLVISDGTNLYNANSASTSVISALQLGNGTAANPSLYWQNDSTTGLYSPASGNIGIAIGGTNVGILASTGLQLSVGINGGAF